MSMDEPKKDSGYGRLKRSLLLLFMAGTLASCASLPSDVGRDESQALSDTGDTTLGRVIQPALERNPGLSGFHVLHGGAEAFARRIRMVQHAERSIDIQYYIWHFDLTGNGMYNTLLHAADRGVRIRILLDDLDTAGKDETLHLIDHHPNIEIRLYNPFAHRDRRGVDFAVDTGRVNHRMHTKTLTVDNQVTVFGGRNIGDEYFAADTELGFNDVDALAVGPIVQEVSEQFDLFWNSQNVYRLRAFAADLVIEPQQMQLFRQQSDEEMDAARASPYAAVLNELEAHGEVGVESLNLSWSEWFLAYDHPERDGLEDIDAETNLAPKLLRAMAEASDELLIVSPYFVPAERLTQFLTDRVKQGVTVKVLTNSLQSNDVALVHAGYMRYREDLLAGGVELYEYKATRTKSAGDEVGRKSIQAAKSSLHAKLFGFDREHLFVGSFNLDPRSIVLNTELGAYFRKPEVARGLSQVFESDITRIAYRVQLDEDGELEWITRNENGEEMRVEHDPDTTFWKRFGTRVLSPVVPESEL